MELELPRLLTPDLSFDWYSWKKTYILFMSITRHGSSVFLVTTSLCRDQVIYASAAFLRSDSRFSCHFWFQYQCAIVNIFDEDEHLYANVNIFDSSIRISFHVITQPVQPHTMISGERCLMTRLLFFYHLDQNIIIFKNEKRYPWARGMDVWRKLNCTICETHLLHGGFRILGLMLCSEFLCLKALGHQSVTPKKWGVHSIYISSDNYLSQSLMELLTKRVT